MNISELESALAIESGKVVVGAGKLTSDIDRFLVDYHDNQPLVITEAKRLDGEGAVRISGRSSFLEVPDLPVTATFSTDSSGQVQALLEYNLVDSAPGPDHWKFSRSLPGLPKVFNYETPVVSPYGLAPDANYSLMDGQIPYLDSLRLFDTLLQVSSHPRPDQALERGLNVASKLRPDGVLGLLLNTFGHTDPLALRGTIRVPKQTEVTTPLEFRQYPWTREGTPGVLLGAALGQGGKLGPLRFENPVFHIYSPHDAAWQRQNTSFEPCIAYTGALAIPSASISVDVTALTRWGQSSVLLFGDVNGVTLARLGHLADLAGADDLHASLPEPFQKAAETLGKLALTYLSVDLSASTDGLSVGTIGFTVGMPDFRWKIWGDHLVVSDISCDFSISNPFGVKTEGGTPVDPRHVSVGLRGTVEIEGVPIEISASSDEKYKVYGRLLGQQTIPLEKLMKTHAPGIPAPADLTVDSMCVTVAPGSFYALSTSLASRPHEWEIDLGPEKLKIEDVALNLVCEQGAPTSGSFSGTVEFAKDLMLSMRYDVPGNFMIRSVFPEVKLSQLVGRLCNQKAPLPSGFDPTFEGASVLIQKSGENYTFQLGTQVENFGALAFEARKVSASEWGFAVGMDLDSGSPSKLPGLSALAAFERLFKLQKFMLVVSSFENPSFQFPDLAQFNSPQLGAKNLALPSRASGVIAGMMLFAEWSLDPKSREQELLRKLLGVSPTLEVTLAIGEDPAKDSLLFTTFQTKIQGHPFVCKFGVQLTHGSPSLFLTGSLTVNIQGQPQTFDVTMVYVPTGAFLSATMKGGTSVDCKAFKLSNLALEIGVDWGGIPSLGIAATIDVKNFESSVALFFDSANPAQSLVAGSVSDLTLKDVVDTLLGGPVTSEIDGVLKLVGVKGTHQFQIPGALANDLDTLNVEKVAAAFASAAKIEIPSSQTQTMLSVNTPGSVWHLTDLTKMRHYMLKKRGDTIEVSIEAQFYFAPQATYIGTIAFPQGYYLNGAIEFLGYEAEATIDISTSKGIAVDAEMERLVIGNEAVFSLSAAEGKGGPKVSLATFSRPEEPVKEFRTPHFYINGRLEMLGLKESIFASVSTKGILLKLHGGLAPGVNFDLDVQFGGKGLSVDGTVKAGVGTIDLGPLGKVKLDTDVEGRLEIRVNDKDILIAVEADFRALGQDHKIAKFKLDAKPDALAKLADRLGHEVEKVLSGVLKDVGKWANAVKNGAIEGVEDTEKVLKNVYGKSEQEAKLIAHDIDKETQVIGKALSKGAQAAGKAVSKGTQAAGKAMGKGAQQAGKAVSKGAKDAGKAMDKGAKDVGKAVDKGAKDVGKEAKKIGKVFKKLF